MATKWTDGVVCRDRTGEIVFFVGTRFGDPVLKRTGAWAGVWLCDKAGKDGTWQSKEWSTEDWNDTYDLAPPAKGKKFEAQLEL